MHTLPDQGWMLQKYDHRLNLLETGAFRTFGFSAHRK